MEYDIHCKLYVMLQHQCSYISVIKATQSSGWSGGSKVLGKLPVPGGDVLLTWITVGQGPIALAVDAGGGCLDIFLSSIISVLFLPLCGRRPDID